MRKNPVVAHLVLVIATHAAALGCGVPVQSGSPSNTRGADKGEAHAPTTCVTSFDCALGSMCGEAGMCVPAGEAVGQWSPILDDSGEEGGSECLAHDHPHVGFYHYELMDVSDELYGEPAAEIDPSKEGSVVRSYRESVESIDRMIRGEEDVAPLEARIRSLLWERSVARSAEARYEELVQLGASVQFGIEHAVYGRPRGGPEAAMIEALVAAFDVGVRLVERDGAGGFVPHAAYGEVGWTAGLDARGAARDGLYYVDAEEVRLFAEAPFDYEGVSRLGQVLSVVERDQAVVESLGAAVASRASILDEGGQLGSTLGELVTAGVSRSYWLPELRHIYGAALGSARERARTYWAAVATANVERDFRALVTFWHDVPEARAVLLARNPHLAPAECGFAFASHSDFIAGLGSLGLVLGVVVGFLLLHVVAVGLVVGALLYGIAIIGGAVLGLSVAMGHTANHVTGPAEEGPSVDSMGLGPVLSDVAAGALTGHQAAMLVAAR